MFKKLSVNLLFSFVYHSQIDDLFERSNQTIEIALRYLTSEYSDLTWVSMLSTLQISLNNALNVSIERFLNEIVYDFKIRKTLTALNIENHINIEKERFRHRAEAVDVTSFAAVKFKIYYDVRHQSLLLKSDDQTFLRLNHEYFLSEKSNSKLFNQRIESFLVKRRIERLIYELELSSQWRVHSVVSIAQLKPMFDTNSYNRYRSHHSAFVHMKEDTEVEKFYEVKKLINRRIRRYEKKNVTQYLIRWVEYESKYDEWKSLSTLNNFMTLMKVYDRGNSSKSTFSIKSKKRDRLKKSSKKSSKEKLNWRLYRYKSRAYDYRRR